MNETLLNEYDGNLTHIITAVARNHSTEPLELASPEPDVPAYIVIILIVIGTIGNVLVCLTIFMDKKLQNVTNFFLLSLAITDLMINVVILPARIAVHIYVLQPSTFPLCFSYLLSDEYLTSASALHICFISFERYFAIKNPLDMRSLTMKRVYVKIIFVWLLSFLTIIPYLTIVIISNYPTKQSYCLNLVAYFEQFNVILYMESFVIFVMVFVVAFSFVGTSSLLYKLAKNQEANGIGNNNGMVRTVGGNKSEASTRRPKNKLQELSTEKKAIKVVWLVSFAFIIAMGPYAVVNLIFLISPRFFIHPCVLKVVSYLAYTNSVINPIIYTIFNKRFRRNFKNLIMLKYKHV